MLRSCVPAVLCLALSACGAIPFIGDREWGPAQPLPFETRILVEDGAPDFGVQVNAGGAGLDAVRESVRFEATRYCRTRFGTSDIVWAAPAGQPDNWTAQGAGDGVRVYSGQCLGR